MARKAKKRSSLKNARGETIAEVLVALLISVLGMMMLAGMISSSGNLILESMRKMDSYVSEENRLASLDASGAVTTAEGTVSFSQTKNGTSFKLTDNAAQNGIPVTYYRNEQIGNKPVISYSRK